MKLTIFGTCAAEGWPALYCDCPNCEAARRAGGHSIRTRSQSLVNNDLLIDFPGDTYHHVLSLGLDLRPIHDLIVTHNHEDHFVPNDLFYRKAPFGHLKDQTPINIYGNEAVRAEFMDYNSRVWGGRIDDCINFHDVRAFEPFKTSTGRYTVHPMRADHDRNQNCVFYIIEDSSDGRTLLYAHDTGYFFEENWDYIAKNKFRFDIITLDCTHQTDPQRTNHMGLPICAEVRDRLRSMGALSDSAPCLVNHFSHNGACGTHEELSAAAEKYGFICAYDGIRVEG